MIESIEKCRKLKGSRTGLDWRFVTLFDINFQNWHFWPAFILDRLMIQWGSFHSPDIRMSMLDGSFTIATCVKFKFCAIRISVILLLSWKPGTLARSDTNPLYKVNLCLKQWTVLFLSSVENRDGEFFMRRAKLTLADIRHWFRTPTVIKMVVRLIYYRYVVYFRVVKWLG